MNQPELIYCAAGGKKPKESQTKTGSMSEAGAGFAEIAIRYGFTYGAQLPGKVYFHPVFADQNWKNPRRAKYMAALEKYRPRLATVLDWEHDDQRDEVMSWAEEAAQWVSEAVIVIPKVCGTIPLIPEQIGGKPVRLGYSVDTRHGHTDVPTFEFGNRPVHLLGGSPHEQIRLATGWDRIRLKKGGPRIFRKTLFKMNVVSADTNYHQKQAKGINQFFTNGGATWAKTRHFPRLDESPFGRVEHNAPYFAFELSCMNIQAAWAGCHAVIRWAVEGDLLGIKAIANQYKDELGYVMMPTLRKSLADKTLVVAEINQQIVGFVNYRARTRKTDPGQTIYEIAVHRDFRGQKIGAGLLAAVPRPVRLKCTVDNQRGNEFYEASGLVLAGTESGRKRPLNVWKSA